MTGKQEEKIITLLESILFQLQKMSRKSNTVRKRSAQSSVKYLP
jgi:hypothetical protein